MENNEEKIPYKLILLDIVIVFLIIGLSFAVYNKTHQPIKNNVAPTGELAGKVFDELDIKAKSAYVYDVMKNKVLYQKNDSTQLPLASITKLMTATVAMDLVPQNSQITIKKEFLQEEGDSGLRDGEIWNLKNLLDFSLIVSSNDGARAVASVVGSKILKTEDMNIGRSEFVNKMNEKAKEIGLSQTYFVNESGLDEKNGQSGGMGSAQDVAKMVEYILKNKPEVLEATRYQSQQIASLSIVHKAQNTNVDINKIPNIIGSKTGYTDLAGGNLAVVFDSSIGNPVIVVVLGSTQEGRFDDVLSLVDATMKYERN